MPDSSNRVQHAWVLGYTIAAETGDPVASFFAHSGGLQLGSYILALFRRAADGCPSQTTGPGTDQLPAMIERFGQPAHRGSRLRDRLIAALRKLRQWV
jgi:hypothetical protein